MTIQRRALEAAAFWDQAVCLDCEAFFHAEGEEGQAVPEAVCPLCGSDATYSAEFVLRVAGSVAAEGEES